MSFLMLFGGYFSKVKGFLFFFLTILIIDVPGIRPGIRNIVDIKFFKDYDNCH